MHGFALLLLLSLMLFDLASPSPAAASARLDAVQRFEELAAGSRPGLEVSVQNAKANQVNVDDRIAFEFESDRDAYLTAVYLDSHGVVTVLFPTQNPEDGHLTPGQRKRFPPQTEFTVSPPLGLEHVLVMTTPRPLRREYLVTNATDEPPILDPIFAVELIQNMATLAERFPPGSVSAVVFSQTVVGKNRYRSAEIVQHFGRPVTRSLHRQKLDLEIHFEFDRDTLTEDARQQLDEVGRALTNPKLKGRRFSLLGYTDDIGTDQYNMELSQRRAKAAREYLMEQFGLDAEKLDAMGMGEADPLMPGNSERARELNRRVTLSTRAPVSRSLGGARVPDLDALDLSDALGTE